MPNTLSRTPAPVAPQQRPDERAARRNLMDQVARLEQELRELFCSAWPRTGLDFGVPGHAGPRLLSLGELEELRDDLAGRVATARRQLAERAAAERRNRRLIEAMLSAPERHRWVRVSNADIGEPGCRHWHVRPRLGPIGMLMNWWRVVISSGCPLATCHATRAAGPDGSPLA